MVHLAYGSHFLQKASVTLPHYCPFAWECQALYTQLAVHLIACGSVPVLYSVFYISLNPWEAPGWQVTAIDADVKRVITSWLQTFNNSALTWNISLGTIVGQMPRWWWWLQWCLMWTICFMCSMYWSLHSDMRVFVTLFFESSLYIHCSLSWWVHKYWILWMVGFLCHLLIIFTMNYLF